MLRIYFEKVKESENQENENIMDVLLKTIKSAYKDLRKEYPEYPAK